MRRSSNIEIAILSVGVICASASVALPPVLMGMAGCVSVDRGLFEGGPRYVYLDALGLYNAAAEVYLEVRDDLSAETQDKARKLDTLLYATIGQMKSAVESGDEARLSERLAAFREALAEFEALMEE